MPAWPLAGAGLPPEPVEPALAIPRGALRIPLRDLDRQGPAASIGSGLPSPQAEPPQGAAGRAGRSRWPAAVVASCALHAAVALALLAAPMAWHAPADRAETEGADQAGMTVAGNADDDQATAGAVTNVTLVPVVAPKPIETIAAEPVAADATEAPVAETVEPAAAETVEPERPDEAVPEILAAAQPAPDGAEAVAPQEEAVETPQTVDVVPEARPKPARKTAEAAERAEKARPARNKAEPGSGGADAADAKRGLASGKAEGETAIASRGGALPGVGNAAVSNYPGKVAARLRRVARTISRAAQASAVNNAQVAFVVGARGDVRSVRLVRSSGSPGLDEAALSIIQRAAPFPPIPPQAGRPDWAFTLPIGPF